jgi:DNA-binding transcriptional ArsR family regulator
MPNPDPSLDRALHAIADPTRRRILQVLKKPRGTPKGKLDTRTTGLCAGDIEERVGLSQPTISHHMAILTKAGLVEAVKQGQWRWYRRDDIALRQMIKTLRSKL